MRKHRKKQCQTWSRILPTPMVLLISAPMLSGFLQKQPTVLHQSPWECILGADTNHSCWHWLVTSDTNQRTRGKAQRGSLCQHLWREDNHFAPPQRPFFPRILPKSQWQQTETMVKEFHLFQLRSEETPVIIVRWPCIPIHSSIPPPTSLPSVPEFMCACGCGFSPRLPRGSNSSSLCRFHNTYLPGIKVNKAHHTEV